MVTSTPGTQFTKEGSGLVILLLFLGVPSCGDGTLPLPVPPYQEPCQRPASLLVHSRAGITTFKNLNPVRRLPGDLALAPTIGIPIGFGELAIITKEEPSKRKETYQKNRVSIGSGAGSSGKLPILTYACCCPRSAIELPSDSNKVHPTPRRTRDKLTSSWKASP